MKRLRAHFEMIGPLLSHNVARVAPYYCEPRCDIVARFSAWLEPVKTIGGQDHLGTLAPCEAVYTQLLPGITNNTNRARCYSFYPWLLWAIERAGWPKDAKAIVQAVRKAECLLCLIGIAHEGGADASKHGGGLAGREKLVPAWNDIRDGGTLRLSTFATTEDNERRYWKHTLGGLGQYYLGTLRELRLIDGDAREGLRFSKERAGVLAEALASGVDGARFLKAIEDDIVSRKTPSRPRPEVVATYLRLGTGAGPGPHGARPKGLLPPRRPPGTDHTRGGGSTTALLRVCAQAPRLPGAFFPCLPTRQSVDSCW